LVRPDHRAEAVRRVRDARVLSEILLDDDDWSAERLTGYREERVERMSRLRFVSALASMLDQHGATSRLDRLAPIMERAAKSPELVQARACALIGAWAAPPEAFEPSHLTALALDTLRVEVRTS
jgi:hypothetical protein